MIEKILPSGVKIRVPEQQVIEPVEPPETIEQKLERMEQDNLILMDVLATLYDELQTIKGGTE
jgi:hypothetical protein